MSFEDDLYKEIILENYKSKKHRGSIEAATLELEGANPLCGDDITLYFQVEDGIVTETKFEGSGCSICMASTNLLCSSLEGRSIKDVEGIITQFKGMLLDNETPNFPEEISDLEALEGVKNYPVRIKCAVLPWNTATDMIKELSNG
ncbi:Fe-S cluster assembly sulfur transfer protein SufU [Spirochaeta cellobiosiphila]|uniref:Fe-S cluster assembly sulfur transfer protein SufU n=1 Tax=Spirochaeta cellobiosiphila TaxID=504483 RepID=UPI000411F1B7|nr:SUF system NifU family Fe-S cluster assembly protein [Spirochaeta cellobiosiphila]